MATATTAAAKISEFRTLGDVARAAGAHPNSTRKIALRMGVIAGRIGHFNLIKVEDFPAVVAEVRRRIKTSHPAA
jgi:hypothetical protein